MSSPWVKQAVAEGFFERQQLRDEQRKARNEKLRIYNARMKAMEAALAATRPPNTKASGRPRLASLPKPSHAS